MRGIQEGDNYCPTATHTPAGGYVGFLVKGERFHHKPIRAVLITNQIQEKMSHDLWTEAALYRDVDQPQAKAHGVTQLDNSD